MELAMRFLQVITVATAFVTSPIALAQTQVPNEFQAGTPARASEVNANFDALEAAIDQNAAELEILPRPLRVSANGQILGMYIGGLAQSIVYTAQDYFFLVHAQRNTIAWNPPGDMFVISNDSRVYYEDGSCSGQGYIPTTNNNPEAAPGYGPVAITHGMVFRNGAGDTFYVPKTAQPTNIQPDWLKRPDGITCIFAGAVNDWWVEVLPNDPAVTGVPNEVIQRPITLVR
jgi:hypothetical protein